MPSLNLRNPLRRDPSRPTLKQRAAALKATAAGMIRKPKPKPLPSAGSPEAMEAFGAACRAVDAASRLSDAEMEALHITPGGASLWTSDTVTAAQNGDFSRFAPREIEAARATPRARLEEVQILALRRELRMAEAAKASRIRELHALVYGDEPDPDDGSEAPAPSEPDPIFALIQTRAQTQTAFDAWGEAQGDAPMTDELHVEEDALSDASLSAYRRMISTAPTTAAGRLALLDRLRIEMDLHGMANGDPPHEGHPFWPEFFGALRGALGEPTAAPATALDLALEPTGADPRLVAMVAEWQEQRRKHDDPAFCETPEANEAYPVHAGLQREIYLYPARTPLDLLAKTPVFRDELAEAIRGANGEPTENMAGAAWTGLLADIERIAGTVAPADDTELIALGRAFDVAAARAMDAEDVLEATPGDAEKELDAANETASAAFALAEQMAPLPVHSLAGIQAKLRVAAFYGTCSPHGPLEGERTGEIAIRSLYRSTPGIEIGATASDTRIVPEA